MKGFLIIFLKLFFSKIAIALKNHSQAFKKTAKGFVVNCGLIIYFIPIDLYYEESIYSPVLLFRFIQLLCSVS